jgi:hypothetical protein
LFDVIDCARCRLDSGQLTNYLHRLAHPIKHQDLLFEFVPVVRLDSSVQANYEVAGYAEGNNSADWLIRSGNLSVLLDVKNRTRDLIESIGRFQRGERDPDGTLPAPMHDPSLLFRSVESKLRPRSLSEIIQAVWIVTALKQEESELQAAFARLDASRVHLALLGDWEDDVYVLTNDVSAKDIVLQLFHLRESRRAVFRRGVDDPV